MKRDRARDARGPYVGSYLPRVDGWEKASGKALYVDDVTLQKRITGLLYAKVLRSPHPHAKIKRLDTSAAEALPGVRAVLRYDDPEVTAVKANNAGWTPGSFLVSYDRMFFPHLRDRRVLEDEVRWVGDLAGVAVAAETEDIAEEALRLIDVEWEILPFVLEPEDALREGAPLLHPDVSGDTNVLPLPPPDWPLPGGASRVMFDRGDLEAAYAEADLVVELDALYQNTPVTGSLDNWCCAVDWEADGLTVWSNNFSAYATRMFMCQMFDLPLHKVRTINHYVGGSFGGRDTGEQPFFLFTALLSKKAGRPVKFRHTRREDFLDTRTGQRQSAKVAATRDGRITALHLKLVGNAGAYADHTEGAMRVVAGEWMELNFGHIPSVKAETYSVYTNRIPSSCKRGIGNLQMNWLMGLIVDEVADRLGLDPVDVAVNNFQFEHEPLPNEFMDAVLRAAAERIGWAERHKPGQGPTYEGVKKRGLGMSFNHSWQVAWTAAATGGIQVLIRVNRDGTVQLEAPTVETGPGSSTICVATCAETLGVRMEDVHWVSEVDTQISLRDTPQTGSRVSHILPEAIKVVAEEAKAKLKALAAPEFGIGPDGLEIENGKIFSQGDPDGGVTIADVLGRRDGVPLVTTGTHYLSTDMTGAPYVAAFAEVEVDTETGMVDVLRLVICNDCGTIMYPTGAESQQIGGQAMGIGEALTEEIVYDARTGIPLNFNWIDYKIPTMADLPDVDPMLMEVWKGAGHYGACGMGESVLTCTPRAIANAIYNAIGVRVDATPPSPDKILRALGEQGGVTL